MTGFGDGSGISWTICKQSAPRSRQITTTTPHHSISTGRMLFLTPNKQCQSNGGTYYYHYYCYDKIKTVEIKTLVTEDIFWLLPYWLEKMKTVFIEK